MKNALLLFTILFCFAFNAFSQTSLKLESEEYSVYKAVLKERFTELIPKRLLIRKFTSSGAGRNNRGLPNNTELLPSGIESKTLENFLTRFNQSVELKNKFRIAMPVGFATDEDMKPIWATLKTDLIGKAYAEAMEKKYKTTGLFTFSRVGFNQSKTQALVHIEYSSTPTVSSGSEFFPQLGSGNIILLSKKNKQWTIVSSFFTWIS